MWKISFSLFGVLQAIGLAIAAAFVAALFLATAAQAQTPNDDQYGGPSAVRGSSQAGGGSGGGAGSEDGKAKAGGSSGRIAQVGVSQPKTGGESGNAKAGGSGAKAGVGSSGRLPATGGPSLLVLAGALAASGAGLMLLRFGRSK